ncbi:MAG: hypothetical protein R3A52_16955 [Polyangiales bacterium]
MKRVIVLALCVAGCGSTVGGASVSSDAGADGSAPVDVPHVTGPCAWTPGEAVVVSLPEDQSRFALVDAVATGDGALVAWRERALNGGPDAVRVVRVDGAGRRHPWSADGSLTRGEVVTLPMNAPLQFSMAWEPSRARAVMLAGGPTDRGPCVFAAFTGTNEREWQQADPPTDGVSLSGCGSLGRHPNGWSYLTQEVRALWGDQLVRMDDSGRVAGATRLAMTARQPDTAPTRNALGGGFVARWTESMREGLQTVRELHLRRYDALGEPVGEDVVAQRIHGAIHDPRVVEVGDGALAVWREGVDTLPPLDGVAVRPLAGDLSPRGDVVVYTRLGFVVGGLDATARDGEVLAVTALGSGVIRAVLLSFDAAGALRVGPVALPIVSDAGPLEHLRVVATPEGALVIATRPEVSGTRVVAVPVACR